MDSDDLSFKWVLHDLRSSVADLYTVNPWLGVLRFFSLGFACLSCISLAWQSSFPWSFVGWSAVAGFFYAIWFICTHDAVHHTLTGWTWFDEGLPRLISYPMVWMHGVYAQLHRLHHGWNGTNLQDPERVQWTVEEYQNAAPWTQGYVRHQWTVDLFVLGGFGMIGKTMIKGWQLGEQLPAIRRAFLADMAGIVIVQVICLTWAVSSHHLLHYLFFWLILERVIGVVIQARDHLEHYGMWSKAPRYQLTQLYSSRNLAVHPWVSWWMGGLNYHAVHHAFPNIPFNQLAIAFSRIQQILVHHHLPPMTVGSGYVQETQRLRSQPLLIGDPDPVDSRGRYEMIDANALRVGDHLIDPLQ